MNTLYAIAPLAAIWLAAHLAMGPDFLITVRTAVTQPGSLVHNSLPLAGSVVGNLSGASPSGYEDDGEIRISK